MAGVSPYKVESTGNQQKYGIRALVDSGATGVFIDWEYVKSNQIPTKKLSIPIPVRNVDGTDNTSGAITEVAELILRYNGHSERALFGVVGLGRQNLILGHTWLQEHNPEVLENWRGQNVLLLSKVLQWMSKRSKGREENLEKGRGER